VTISRAQVVERRSARYRYIEFEAECGQRAQQRCEPSARVGRFEALIAAEGNSGAARKFGLRQTLPDSLGAEAFRQLIERFHAPNMAYYNAFVNNCAKYGV
jgi:hypothetical protein